MINILIFPGYQRKYLAKLWGVYCTKKESHKPRDNLEKKKTSPKVMMIDLENFGTMFYWDKWKKKKDKWNLFSLFTVGDGSIEEGRQAQLNGTFVVLLLVWHIWTKAFTILDILWIESYTIVLDITTEQAEQLKLHKALKYIHSVYYFNSHSFTIRLHTINLILIFLSLFYSGKVHSRKGNLVFVCELYFLLHWLI